MIDISLGQLIHELCIANIKFLRHDQNASEDAILLGEVLSKGEFRQVKEKLVKDINKKFAEKQAEKQPQASSKVIHVEVDLTEDEANMVCCLLDDGAAKLSKNIAEAVAPNGVPLQKLCLEHCSQALEKIRESVRKFFREQARK